jgi:hypothetical protein
VITTDVGVAEAQEFAEGVIVYVTVCVVLDVLVNVCAMVFPDPAAAPVTDPDVATVHVNVEPPTLLVNEIAVVLPEQIVALSGVAVATGNGSTVITTVIGVPGQPLAVGVIMYVAV